MRSLSAWQAYRARCSSLSEFVACVQAPKKKIRLGLPATQWITIYNAHRPMKQRYHYNVANTRVDQHVEKGNDDGLYISSVACCHELWALIMDAGTGFSAQVSYRLKTPGFSVHVISMCNTTEAGLDAYSSDGNVTGLIRSPWSC